MLDTTPTSSASVPGGTTNPDTDRDLVDAWVSRADQGAFARLVERHQGYVFRLTLSVLGPGFEADAEDVAQEVFIRVAGRLQDFRGDSAFRTWLHRLALNMAVDRRRRPRWRKPHVDPAVLDRWPAMGQRDDPFGAAEASERSRAVRCCLDSLPDSLRSVIHLRYWLDLRAEDIAVTLQIPLGTVKSHLHRGRALLARAMRAKGLTPGGPDGRGAELRCLMPAGGHACAASPAGSACLPGISSVASSRTT